MHFFPQSSCKYGYVIPNKLILIKAIIIHQLYWFNFDCDFTI